MKRFLMAVILLALPISGHAGEKGFYTGIGFSNFKFYKVKLSPFEQRAVNTPGMISSSRIQNESTSRELTLGYCFNTYVCADVTGLDGIEVRTNLTVNTNSLGVVTIGGTAIDLTNFPASVATERTANVSAVRYSVIGKYPVSDWFEMFARVGMYKYNATLTSKVSLPDNLYIAMDERESGSVLTGGIGADIELSPKMDLQVEYFETKSVSLVSWTFIRRF